MWNESAKMSKDGTIEGGRDFDLNLIWENSDGDYGPFKYESNEECLLFYICTLLLLFITVKTNQY